MILFCCAQAKRKGFGDSGKLKPSSGMSFAWEFQNGRFSRSVKGLIVLGTAPGQVAGLFENVRSMWPEKALSAERFKVLFHALAMQNARPRYQHSFNLRGNTMPIYKYQKVSDQHTTYTLQTNPDQVNQELCTIDGVTYHYVEGELPDQFEQLAIEEALVDEPLEADIKAHSPVIQLINKRVRDAIEDRYTIADEIKMLRIGSGPEFDAYNAYVEDCRAWGRTEKAKYGL